MLRRGGEGCAFCLEKELIVFDEDSSGDELGGRGAI